MGGGSLHHAVCLASLRAVSAYLQRDCVPRNFSQQPSVSLCVMHLQYSVFCARSVSSQGQKATGWQRREERVMASAAGVTEDTGVACWKGIQNCRRVQQEFTDAKLLT